MTKAELSQQTVRKFKKRCDKALAKISDIDKFRTEDAMVDFVFKVGKELFKTPLDQMHVGNMLRKGGKLAGSFVYLGQKSARARGERDVYARKAEEMEKERLLVLITKGVKVTSARSQVASEMIELHDFVVQADVSKNQWENITEAVSIMVSFMQSAIKVKEGERFQNSKHFKDG